MAGELRRVDAVNAATTAMAPVNHIIPFSAVDGPGNRTAVFLQGCNLDCKYCHNPETRALCNHCGACIATCATGALGWEEGQVMFDAAACVGCDACISTCPHGASPKVSWKTAQAVFTQVKQQMPFIRGVTVSGGECMLYPAFVRALFALCKEAGLGTLIDSNGTIPFADYPDLLAVTDGVMLDVKAFRRADSMAMTGADNRTVLKNARFLAQQGKLYELRTVVVPDLCDAAQVVTSLAMFLFGRAEQAGQTPAVPQGLVNARVVQNAQVVQNVPVAQSTIIARNTLRYKLIAYRPFGVREAYRDMQTPTEAQMQALATLAKQQGFGEVVVV